MDKHTIATLILLRSTSMIQAAILLIERGMAVEACLVIRSVLENAFCIAALHDNPDRFVEMFRADDAASRKAQAKFILANGLADPDSPGGRALKNLIDQVEKGTRTLPIPDLAELGPISKQYLLYRFLSNSAAHPSALSLRRYINVMNDGSGWSGFVLGPAEQHEVKQTLGFLIQSALPVGVGFTQMTNDTDSNSQLGEISNQYESLLSKQSEPTPAPE